MWRVTRLQDDDDDLPQVLESLDLPGIAKYIQSKACKHIFVMAGAGISTAAGIPDFRSPDTGLYANLARLKLPYPEAVFDIGFFRRNPVPFYTLAHELAPGRYKPTLTHAFIRLLAEKERLHTCFTQNIDTLERKAGVPSQKIVEAHGSFADQHCIECGAPYPDDKMRGAIAKKEIARCQEKRCNGLVKPDIVFFGENLPPRFFSSVRHLRDADLLIVMGTSLTVHPFASLTELVPKDCPRLLCNLDHVGGWGSRTNDVAALMRVDDAIKELSRLLGWKDDLMKIYREVTEDKGTPDEPGDNCEDERHTPDLGVTGKSSVDYLSEAIERIKLKQDETESEVSTPRESVGTSGDRENTSIEGTDKTNGSKPVELPPSNSSSTSVTTEEPKADKPDKTSQL